MSESNNFLVNQYDWWTEEQTNYVYPSTWSLEVWLVWSKRPANCGQCGTPIEADEAYPSMELSTGAGFPIRVCFPCFQDEQQRRVDAWNEKQSQCCM